MTPADTNPLIDSTAAIPVQVSVVVPVFNASAFLDATVASIYAQSCTNWELILVNDGSTDDSEALCHSYAMTDPRIRVLTQPNRGPSAARNAGMNAATGEFVTFLDADDHLYPNALECLLGTAHDTGSDIILGNFRKIEIDMPLETGWVPPAVFSPDGTPFDGIHCELSGQALLDYVRHFLNFPSNHLVSYCWARLYRMSVIRQHQLFANESMRLFEDFAFNLEFLARVRRLVFVNVPVYAYVLRPRHLSASMVAFDALQLANDMQQFRRSMEDFLAALGVSEPLAMTVRREVGHTLVHYVIIFLIRTGRQIDRHNMGSIFCQIRRLLAMPVLTESLPCYVPKPGNSRLLPWLMRFRLAGLVALIGWLKGNRRYGRLRCVNRLNRFTNR